MMDEPAPKMSADDRVPLWVRRGVFVQEAMAWAMRRADAQMDAMTDATIRRLFHDSTFVGPPKPPVGPGVPTPWVMLVCERAESTSPTSGPHPS